MASPTYALHRIRRNLQRKTSAPPEPPTKSFDEQRDVYRAIFEELHILGGDLAIDELTDWVVRETTETGNLPGPAAVKNRARAICEEREVILPTDSLLRD